MIVKDAENDLGRCLATVYKVADEIVIGDTGSTDTTKQIAELRRARARSPAVDQHPEGFAGARNEVLAACSGDWFLWIDADEALIHPHELRKYLDGLVYNGYVLHQTHLYLDGPPTFDVPQRLFRNTGRRAVLRLHP
jgi:glycosyltransferase involved in cell wall biosynthesis